MRPFRVGISEVVLRLNGRRSVCLEICALCAFCAYSSETWQVRAAVAYAAVVELAGQVGFQLDDG